MPTKTLPLGTEVTFRGLTGKDEDTLTNRAKANAGEAINEVMANCVTQLGESEKVATLDIERLADPDRRALLLMIRRESFGDEMEAELQCTTPGCHTKFAVNVDLGQAVKDIPAPEGYEPDVPFSTTLSDGTVVAFGYLTGTKEKRVAKAKDSVLTEAMFQRIIEVTGVHKNGIRTWLQNLPARLRAELRSAMTAVECGPDMTVTADCPACGAELSFEVHQQPGFFFPAM